MRLEISFRLGFNASGPILASAIMLGLPSLALSQEIIEVVDGQPITTVDVEQRSKLVEAGSKQPVPRAVVLESLINEIRTVSEAKRRGIDVSDQEVNEIYEHAAIRMGIDAQKLTRLLQAAGAAETFKRRLRAQIAWTKLAGAK